VKAVFFLGGKISPNFDLKIMVSKQRISMENMAQICQISKTKVSESPDFYDKFQ
jgi:hypothetical protein